MAAGTSTGGLDGALPGRVGDSPLPGSGYYVEDGVGGIALSGDGERIARKMLAARIMHELFTGSAESALADALRHVAGMGGEAGGIVLTPDGRFAWEHNSRDFAVGFQDSTMAEPQAYTNKADERR